MSFARFSWSAVLLGGALVVGACRPPVTIDRGGPPSTELCDPLEQIDGTPTQPLDPGELVSGDVQDDAPDRFSLCAKAGTWLSFRFTPSRTAFQPALAIGEGSAFFGENRTALLEHDPATQFHVFDDGDFVVELTGLQDELPGGYELSWSRGREGVRIETDDLPDALPEGDSNPAEALALDGETELWGVLDDGDEADTAPLASIAERALLELKVANPGFAGNGASLTPVLEVVDGGGVVQARLDTRDRDTLRMPVDAGLGPLFLRVSASGAAGERPFYAVEQLSLDNARLPQPERNDGGNGSLAGAQHLSLVEGPLGLRTADVLVQLGPGDLDNFTFDVLAGETFGFSCAADAVGSGVRGLVVHLSDGNGRLLDSGTEEERDTTTIGGTRSFIEPAQARACASLASAQCRRGDARVDGAGTFVANVQATEFLEDVAGRWALCTAFAGPP